MNDPIAPTTGMTLPTTTEPAADIRQAAQAFFPDAETVTAFGEDLLRV